MSAALTHFEIFAENPEQLADFYRNLFGWSIQKAPGVDYFRIQTGGQGSNGMAGGLLSRPLAGPRSWFHYVAVESIDETMKQLQTMGGKVIRSKEAIPKTAWFAIVEDPQGNMFGIYQPDPTALPIAEPE